MKTFQIKAKNAQGRWVYDGLFASSIDAAIDAIERGALSVSVKLKK